MAYATDLYRREDRVEQWLAGHHPRGMVHVDGRDLTPVLRATRDAGTLSAKLGDEIARVVHFLVGDQSSFITGAIWGVNGGMDM